jgi:rubrerythrin
LICVKMSQKQIEDCPGLCETPDMLTTDVRTTSDLMSIALCAEHEAVRRYARLAEAMHRHGNQEAASMFERMFEEEQAHERLIEEWAKLEGVELRTDIGPIVWEDPQLPTDYDNEAVDPEYSSPYRALAFAVHNEERAFRFYIYVAAETHDEAVREYAETLAREELGHAALLRAMRRRAWREEQETGRDEPDVEPHIIHTLADLLSVAVSADQCLADNAEALADSYPELEKFSAATHNILMDTEARLKTVGKPGEDILKAIESIEKHKRKTASMSDDPDALQHRLHSDSDRCFAFYDAVVTHAKDEAVMLAAQKLSESMLERIGLLRDTIKTEN